MSVKFPRAALLLLVAVIGGVGIAAQPQPLTKKDSPMVVEYIRYSVPAERAGAFLEAYQRAGEHLRASPHCLRYEVSRGVEEPNHFIVRIEWDSEEGHLQGFRRSAEFRKFFELVKPFVSDIQEMKHYRVESAWGRP